MTIQQEIHRLAAGQLVELFEVDTTALGGSVLRFHNGTNGLSGSVVWQGQTYVPFPIEASGFEFSGKGKLPRPVLRVANVTGLLGALVRDYQDLIGAKVTRRRTMVKFLDAVNFPARRNLLLRTQEVDQSGWNRQLLMPPLAEVAMAPDGTMTAEGMVPATTTGQHYYEQNITGLTAATNHTSSIHVKPGSVNEVQLSVYGTGNAQHAVRLNMQTGSASFVNSAEYVSGGGVTTSWGATQLTDSWWRIWLSGFPDAAATNRRFRVFLINASGSSSFAGDGATVNHYAWGAQLEAGSVLSPYQPVGAAWNANPTADPGAELPLDVYFIDRKSAENKVMVEFELAAAFDLMGVQLPRRLIVQNYCPWAYRVNDDSSGCSYTGTAYYDINDQPVGSAGQDVCGKRLTSCKLRHGENNPLPFGGMPTAGLTR